MAGWQRNVLVSTTGTSDRSRFSTEVEAAEAAAAPFGEVMGKVQHPAAAGVGAGAGAAVP